MPQPGRYEPVLGACARADRGGDCRENFAVGPVDEQSVRRRAAGDRGLFGPHGERHGQPGHGLYGWRPTRLSGPSLKSQITVVAVDEGPFIVFAMVEHEAEMISAGTKTALAGAKGQGTRATQRSERTGWWGFRRDRTSFPVRRLIFLD
jgi:hypothetical protein